MRQMRRAIVQAGLQMAGFVFADKGDAHGLLLFQRAGQQGGNRLRQGDILRDQRRDHLRDRHVNLHLLGHVRHCFCRRSPFHSHLSIEDLPTAKRLTKAEIAQWKAGDTLLLNGKMLTGRDAAHKRIQDMLAKGEKLPVDFTNRTIYYVGPVDPIKGEAVGPAGPTTATRMDKFTEMMLAQTGLISMIGKAERGPTGVDAIKKHKSAYLMAVGGAAYLVSKAIKTAKVVGFADMGMEAIYEFDVVDMPVTVAVDAGGTSAHITGPALWKERIATGEFKGITVAEA